MTEVCEGNSVSDHQMSRVHFPEEQISDHDSEIIVRGEGEGDRVTVHLGFLQIHHHYEVQVTIKDTLGEEVTFDPLQNLYLKILEVMPSEDGEGHDLLLDLKAHKEKLMREEITITSVLDVNKSLTISLHSRVLGKGKGTPSLKTGIKCTGIDVEEDSEQSDWQGFD